MKTITTIDLIRGVAEKWRRQYAPFDETHVVLFSARHGHTELRPKRVIYEELLALDPETATAEDVNRIIGNDTWTSPVCEECGSITDAVVVVEGEDANVSLCFPCVEKAHTLMKQIGH